MSQLWLFDTMEEHERIQVENKSPLWGDVKPKTYYYHYSNPESQGALICCTQGFPSAVPKGMTMHAVYSDRMRLWDCDHFGKLCDMIGGSDCVWAYKAGALGDAKLREVGKFAFHLDTLPEHVRFVHYYNVATGFSCPTIEVIAKNV